MVVLRSLLRNAAALALLVAVASSNHATPVAAERHMATHSATTRHLAANAAVPHKGHEHPKKQTKRALRKMKKSGCVVIPGGNSTKPTKPSKTPKAPKPSKTPAATPVPIEDDDESPVTMAPSDDDEYPVTTAPSADDAEGNEEVDAEATTAPKPTTAKPKAAATPKPAAASPKPAAATPKPAAATPKPAGATPKPAAATPKPATATPKPAGATPKPATGSGGKLCAVPKLTVSEIDVGATVIASEDEVALKVLAIAAKPGGGSYVAFHTSGGKVQVAELDASDKVVAGASVSVSVVDFADIYADAKGFVLLGTRAAQGGGTLNCGNPSNLCGTAPSPAVPCYDMYLIRVEGGKETWATKLTTSSASLPPYSTGKTGADVYMIWWYAHHGRIAYDGTNWAAYFGVAISTSEGGCINIHQGDRMQVVGPTGALVKAPSAFELGCSHSGYERVAYDARAKDFAMICKTDNNNRIKAPNGAATIYPVDLAASNLGDIVPSAGASGYWMTVSNGNGANAKTHLMHFEKNKATDKDVVLGGANANERACHLAAFGTGGLLAVWEGSSAGGDLMENAASRTMYVQVRSATDGAQVSDAIKVDASVKGNRYQAFTSFPDGTVAYVSKGSAATKVKVLRIAPC